MKIFKKLIFAGLFSIICKVNIAQSIVKLKGTGYYITLPSSYKIQKFQGIDYKTFYILNKSKPDSSKTFVMFGCCVGTIGENLVNMDKANKIDSLNQILLGQEVQWKIYNWDSNYLAETLIFNDDFGKVVFGIKTKHKNYVSLLISSFGTMRKTYR